MADVETIAVIFDFDDTLVPDSTTKLIRSAGIDPDKFWKRARTLLKLGYDPTLAYLRLLLEDIGEGKPLGPLTAAALEEFGAGLDQDLYAGLPQLFHDLREIVARYRDIEIEFYIISGGILEILKGSETVREFFTGVYACSLDSDAPDGVLKYIRRAVTFTEKTRYLFEINKGIEPNASWENPYLVNKGVPDEKRRIPLWNMIYVGDGLTDIPCWSVVTKGDGVAIGVVDPSDHAKAKRAFQEFLMPKRVMGVYHPKYDESEELGSWIRQAVEVRCSDILVDRGMEGRPRRK